MITEAGSQNNVTYHMDTSSDDSDGKSEESSKDTEDESFESDDSDDHVPLYCEKTITFASKAKKNVLVVYTS